MSRQLEAIITEILEREGGYVNHPDDKGGPTNFGITMSTLQEWRHKPVTANDVKALSEDEARAIYRDRYIVGPGFAGLPEPLRGLVVDSGVNCGVARVTGWIQREVGVTADGKMGPNTQAAVHRADPKRLYRQVLATRIRHYGRIVTDNPKQAAFAAGWANRAAAFVEMAP